MCEVNHFIEVEWSEWKDIAGQGDKECIDQERKMIYEKSGVTADYREKCPPLLEQPENPKTETRNICKYLKGIYYYIFHSLMIPIIYEGVAKQKLITIAQTNVILFVVDVEENIILINISRMYTSIICAAMRLAVRSYQNINNKSSVQKTCLKSAITLCKKCTYLELFWSECGKTWTRITPKMGTLQAVWSTYCCNLLSLICF